jgi:Domain of unknown function (DUF4136)
MQMNSAKGIRSIAKVFCFMFAVATVAPSPAGAQTVTYNYADHVNFSEFKTYQWVVIEGASAADPTLDAEIRAAIDAQFAARGFARSAEPARLLIAYQVSQEREIPIGMVEWYWQYGPGWSFAPWYGYSRGFVIDDPSTLSTENGMAIEFGHLILDAYDPAYRDLVWRGRVTKAITFGRDSQKRRRQLNKAVAKLIKAFPHQPTE